MTEKRVSVRHLVEFLYRSGDIDYRHGEAGKIQAMQAGGRIHRKIQKSMGSAYQSEVPLAISLQVAQLDLCIEGRADGIIAGEVPLIDEIKGVYLDVFELKEPIPVHYAQALLYAYIYGKEHPCQFLDVQLTYCNLKSEAIRRLIYHWSWQDLEAWFSETMDRYKKFLEFEVAHKKARDASILTAQFPYAHRQGQRDMIASVYRAVEQEKTLYIQAPTGIGKTLGVLYPAIQAMGRDMGDKIFYLTAKTIARTVATDTLDLLQERGMGVSYLSLTAKEKICPLEECICNPETCPYAKGHYDRVNDALYAMITKESAIKRETVEVYAEKYQCCPYEFSLDVAEWVDTIVCDYNYVFDPRVNLKRFFSGSAKGAYLFLVDEAHNLYDRASTMYSAEVVKEDFLLVRNLVKDVAPDFARALQNCNRHMLELKKNCEDILVLPEVDALVNSINRVLAEYEAYRENTKEGPENPVVLQFYFQLIHFSNMYEYCDEHYIIYCGFTEDQSFRVKLLCVDTSANVQRCIERGRSTIFFSATMLPVHYYKSLLSQPEDPAVYIPSPFPQENRLLAIGRDVSSRYNRRGRTEYEKMFAHIEAVVSAKRGNYMIFFPSYQMLTDVYAIAKAAGFDKRYNTITQLRNMDEEAREEFLRCFTDEGAVVGFCTLGGIFSEGIDLAGARLIGAVIVGTGLPMVTKERQLLQEYFEETKGAGFAYAYLYPGMNKVLQAAGRVIRTPEDVGTILLLDERFLWEEYQGLFPMEWVDITSCDRFTCGKRMQDFWREHEDR